MVGLGTMSRWGSSPQCLRQCLLGVEWLSQTSFTKSIPLIVVPGPHTAENVRLAGQNSALLDQESQLEIHPFCLKSNKNFPGRGKVEFSLQQPGSMPGLAQPLQIELTCFPASFRDPHWHWTNMTGFS